MCPVILNVASAAGDQGSLDMAHSNHRASVFNPTPPELVTEAGPPGTAPGGGTHTHCNDLEPILQWKRLPLQPSRAHNLNGCTWQLFSKTQILNSFPQPNKMHVLGAQDQPPS